MVAPRVLLNVPVTARPVLLNLPISEAFTPIDTGMFVPVQITKAEVVGPFVMFVPEKPLPCTSKNAELVPPFNLKRLIALVPVLVFSKTPVVTVLFADEVEVINPVVPSVVNDPAAAVLAPTIPSKLVALILPLTPNPPVITSVPVPVVVEAVPAVKVTAPVTVSVPLTFRFPLIYPLASTKSVPFQATVAVDETGIVMPVEAPPCILTV
jgi:hypothetical protein